VISVALYQTIQEWHGSGVGRREIARRLKIDVKTVRRYLRKIEAGILMPKRSSPVSKLDPFLDRITELAARVLMAVGSAPWEPPLTGTNVDACWSYQEPAAPASQVHQAFQHDRAPSNG